MDNETNLPEVQELPKEQEAMPWDDPEWIASLHWSVYNVNASTEREGECI